MIAVRMAVNNFTNTSETLFVSCFITFSVRSRTLPTMAAIRLRINDDR